MGRRNLDEQCAQCGSPKCPDDHLCPDCQDIEDEVRREEERCAVCGGNKPPDEHLCPDCQDIEDAEMAEAEGEY